MIIELCFDFCLDASDAPSQSRSGEPALVQLQTEAPERHGPPPEAGFSRSKGKPVRANPAPYGQDASRFTLTFAEEFSSGFNRARWNDTIWYEVAPAVRNYAVEDGKLKIWPARDAHGKFFNRTIDTDGKFYQTYGYFEMEARLPRGKGTWPAFWLFNHIGARRPEIDIMEAYAGGLPPWGRVGADGVARPMMYAVTVWRDAGIEAGMLKIATGDLSARFHKYAVLWEPHKLVFYFDGKPVATIHASMPDPMYLVLDLWFGSASGTPDASTPTGKGNAFEVNYVRAWQRR